MNYIFDVFYKIINQIYINVYIFNLKMLYLLFIRI